MNQDEQIETPQTSTKIEQIFRKNAFQIKEYTQLQCGNKKLQKILKEIKQLKARSVDRIFLNVEELIYQADKQLTSDDLDKIKEDKKKYIKFLLSQYKTIFPEELITLNPKASKKNGFKKVQLNETHNREMKKKISLNEQGSSAADENESDNMWDSDFGEMGNDFEESQRDKSLGDGGYDDYD